MGYYEDVYCSPERYDLTIVDSIDDPDACWSFDMLVVWQHADGRLFYAEDSGCSCPSPFEDVKRLDELTEITTDTFGEFAADVTAHCVPYEYVGSGDARKRVEHPDRDPAAADKTQMLAEVSKLLSARPSTGEREQ